MKIKRTFAPTMREALLLVKQEQGKIFSPRQFIIIRTVVTVA